MRLEVFNKDGRMVLIPTAPEDLRILKKYGSVVTFGIVANGDFIAIPTGESFEAKVIESVDDGS